MDAGTSSNDTDRPPCRPREKLEYILAGGKSDFEDWRCPACHAHFEDPVCLSCGDVVCRACVTAIGGVCPTCCEKFVPEQLIPSRMAQRHVKIVQCHCPNTALGCSVIVGVLDVEHHLGEECQWREAECDQCHERVRLAQMDHHKDTTCARKPMACGYADVGCETRCPQGDLPAHERDGVVAHMGLLRQRLTTTTTQLAQTVQELTATKADLTQARQELGGQLTATQTDLAATKAELAETRQELSQTRHELTQTKEELTTVRSQFDQLLTPPPAPDGLEATYDEATPDQMALRWRPVPVPDCRPQVPVRYRVQATPASAREGEGGPDAMVVYTGPECRCTCLFPPGVGHVRLTVVAIRGLGESGPSATASCTRPRPASDLVFTYDHDMDEQGLFYYIGTQGRTQPWQNPAEAGLVTVTRSSESNGKASDAVGRQACEQSYSQNQPNSWYQVDLGASRLFTPTRYTIRHNSHPNLLGHRLQSWRLEGSLDGASWRTLDEHTNEPNAIPARVDAMATFAVAPAQAFPARHFRVLMTSPSPNGVNFLMLAGLEMYGTLRDSQRQHA
ncbi:hypothetical protein PAPYR_6617 [Paratrimastix pyriformis]|uniref:Uncharacterized protein n=1 Tax=Paratrimastix pyriformis TaxID=342808 RepID=A0ABQ8UJB6_9EUKA|nr:hypothetical protein PAPYR_6617 [Paratrimastix pyriformis]